VFGFVSVIFRPFQFFPISAFCFLLSAFLMAAFYFLFCLFDFCFLLSAFCFPPVPARGFFLLANGCLAFPAPTTAEAGQTFASHFLVQLLTQKSIITRGTKKGCGDTFEK